MKALLDKAPLYLGGRRFEVVRMAIDKPADVWGRRRRTLGGFIKVLPDLSINGVVLIPPKCDLAKILHTRAGPVNVKWRGMSGPFWLDASYSDPYMTFCAVAAGKVKWAAVAQK